LVAGPGDHSCCFHALSYDPALDFTKARADDLRREMVQYLMNHPCDSVPGHSSLTWAQLVRATHRNKLLPEYCEELSTVDKAGIYTTWGSSVELHVFAVIRRKNVHVYAPATQLWQLAEGIAYVRCQSYYPEEGARFGSDVHVVLNGNRYDALAVDTVVPLSAADVSALRQVHEAVVIDVQNVLASDALVCLARYQVLVGRLVDAARREEEQQSRQKNEKQRCATDEDWQRRQQSWI
jgi:hypothetical protein